MTQEEFDRQTILHKQKRERIKWMLIIVVASIIGIWIGISNEDDGDDETLEASTSVENAVEEKQLTADELTAQLNRELESFKKPFDNSTYDKTVEALQLELVIFSVWAKLIQQAEASADTEIQKMGATLRSKVSKLQEEEFPILRKKYAQVIYSKLWENDIYVRASGNRNQFINFTSGDFVTNKNIKQAHDLMREVLTMFRYKEARYPWYKGQDDPEYFNIDSRPDSELVEFQ